MVITKLFNNSIQVKVLSGKASGSYFILPRIDFMPSNTDLPFKLRRRQFPIIVAYAMTINKSQGQSFTNVGIYLPKPVFSHGQLYVAFSRARSADNIIVQIENNNYHGNTVFNDGKTYTKNIVFNEIF